MSQISQTTQQNASASEELSATAEEMSSQAEQLQRLVAMFKLDGESTSPVSIGRPPQRKPAASHKRGVIKRAAVAVMPIPDDDPEYVRV